MAITLSLTGIWPITVWPSIPSSGTRQLGPLGFRRVIPARELGLDEIQAICAVPALDVEVFVHGALCYSYNFV